MYCDIIDCAEITPCPIHKVESSDDESQYSFEVYSLGTQWSHFTSISFECENIKHGCGGCMNSCSHFADWIPNRHHFTFRSSKINFIKDHTLWHSNMDCLLCFQEIDSEEEFIVNLCDMCQFHEYCLARYLHKSHFLEECPGCDVTRCLACWRCSY